MSRTHKKISNLLVESSVFWLIHWRGLLKVSAVFWIPVVIFFHLYWNNLETSSWLIERTSERAFGVIDAIINIFAVLFLKVYEIAILRAIQSLDEKKSYKVLSIWKEAFGKLVPYLVVKFLWLLSAAVWSLLLIFPGIYKGLMFCFAPASFVLDDYRGKEALNRSQTIIKPYFVRVFDYLLVAVLFAYCYSFSILVLTDATTQILLSKGMAITAGIVGHIELVVVVYVALFAVVFYYNLYKELNIRNKAA